MQGHGEPGFQSCLGHHLMSTGMWLADWMVNATWLGVQGVWGALTPIMKRINMHRLLMEGCIYNCTEPQVAGSWLPDGSLRRFLCSWCV